MITINNVNPSSVIDDELLDRVIQEEGFLAKPTNIGDGVFTVGSGLTAKKWIDQARRKGKWSEEDNRNAVREELTQRQDTLSQMVPYWKELPDSSKKALLSYYYNYEFNPRNSPSLFKALSNKDYKKAAKEMNATSKNSKFKEGLMQRRLREQEWFLSGFNKEEPIERKPNTQLTWTPLTETPTSTYVNNPYKQQQRIGIRVPKEDSYIETQSPQTAGLFKTLQFQQKLKKLQKPLFEQNQFIPKT